jgi:hypothetical protein
MGELIVALVELVVILFKVAVALLVAIFLIFGVPVLMDAHISNETPLLTNTQLEQKIQSALTCAFVEREDLKKYAEKVMEVRVTGRDISRNDSRLDYDTLNTLGAEPFFRSPNISEWLGNRPVRLFNAALNIEGTSMKISGAERIVGNERKVIYVRKYQENSYGIESYGVEVKPDSSCIR